MQELQQIFAYDITLRQAFLAMSLVRFLILWLMSEIIIYLALRNKSLIRTVFSAALCLLAPNLLIFIADGSSLAFLPLQYFVSANAYILDRFFFMKLFVTFTALIFLLFLNQREAVKLRK